MAIYDLTSISNVILNQKCIEGIFYNNLDLLQLMYKHKYLQKPIEILEKYHKIYKLDKVIAISLIKQSLYSHSYTIEVILTLE